MMSYFSDKRVLITGACGTVGSELVRQLLVEDTVGELVCVDNNETELFFLEQKYLSKGKTEFFLADIRDGEKLNRVMGGVDVVFHAAAFKHVILCERSPFEAVRTNIVGVQNIILAAAANHVRKVIFTSSDKAVNPSSVMGTSKLMGERLMTAAHSNMRVGSTIFSSTRFGNVLGSRGSVIPLFRKQIRRGGPVTLTDPAMTRFIMSIAQAVSLVLDSAILARGGEVMITKMPVIRIQDLAEVMIEDLAPFYGHDPADIEVTIVGSKPGEKLYEELMNSEETRRSLELERYFVVKPAWLNSNHKEQYQYPHVVSQSVGKPYNSDNEQPLSKSELAELLKHFKLLEHDDNGR